MAYSTNKKTIAVYPLHVEYLDDDSTLCKGGIVFLSEDKKHDHQHVEDFERRAFEIFKEKIHNQVRCWKRFSDGCGVQFWSRYVVANLFEMHASLKLDSISYDRFEANEGKSVSDTLGSITKCAFNRGNLKLDEGISTLKSESKPTTKKFNFFHIEEFGSTAY